MGENNTPLEMKTCRNISIQNATSGAREQFLLPECRENALANGAIFTETGMSGVKVPFRVNGPLGVHAARPSAVLSSKRPSGEPKKGGWVIRLYLSDLQSKRQSSAVSVHMPCCVRIHS